MKKHIPYLDGWRGLAIVCLLIGHFFPVDGINLGTVGVTLFFVLSGLLMAQVLFVQRIDFGTFYRRRMSRVFPSVVVYLAAITLIFLLIGKTIAPKEFLSALTFTNNYFVYKDWIMPFGHIWSLSVEEHSYILLSLAAYWCRSRGGRPLLAVAALLSATLLAVAVYTLVPGTTAPSFHLRTEVASFGIFASGFFALALVQKQVRLTQAWMAPAGIITGILAHWWSVPFPLRVIVGAGALALAINAMPSAPRWLVAAFESNWLRRLGIYSFSLYLWQQPFYQLCGRSELSPLLGLVFSLVTGWVAFHLIESPARLYLNKRWAAKSGRGLVHQDETSAVSS